MGYTAADHTIYYRPWIRIFCVLHLLLLCILPVSSQLWHVCWRRVRCVYRHHCPQLLPSLIYLVLLCYIQERRKATNGSQNAPPYVSGRGSTAPYHFRNIERQVLWRSDQWRLDSVSKGLNLNSNVRRVAYYSVSQNTIHRCRETIQLCPHFQPLVLVIRDRSSARNGSAVRQCTIYSLICPHIDRCFYIYR